MSSIAIINTSSPYSSASAQESLDLAMVAGTFGQKVALFFIDDGVFQLVTGQSASTVGRKDFHKSFAALEFYDVEDLYVCQQSLLERNITADNLSIEVTTLAKTALANTIAEYDHILRF
ncbi:sulfurtransferase complex subunit TusC [Neptunicella sp. SCSIO 80796]|uniref:sulfurtransferase complex subunit TusC n=1 Tax=Neptunicella plasticusilytica TaxID=3117012 RepID=UPI003A4DC13F